MLKRIWERLRAGSSKTSEQAWTNDDTDPEPDPSSTPIPPPASPGPPDDAERDEEEQDIFPAIEETSDHPLLPVKPFIGTTDTTPSRDKQTIRIEIPTRTIIKVVFTLVIIWLLLQVWKTFLLLFVAGLLCLALLPPVRRLESRGMPRLVAALSIYVVMALLIVGFFALIVPPLVDQGQSLVDNAPDYVDSFDDVLNRYPGLRQQIDKLVDDEQEPNERADGSEPQSDGEAVVTAAVQAQTDTLGADDLIGVATRVVGGVANVFFVLVLTFYLLIEGERSWRYLSRYLTPSLRYRFYRLGPELTNVVSGYVIGQAINSSLFGIFSFATLWWLGVPESLLLAIIAALMDGIPIVGVPVATVAAMILAATVSWQAMLLVLVLFTVYQQFENYVLVPRIFGNTLQVSALSILVGVLVGGQLLGIIGVVLSLPVTAAIPVIERVWREVLPPEVEGVREGEPGA